MEILVDINVLGRLAIAADPLRATAAQAVAELHRRGESLHITPQNLIEFRRVATRPVASNGSGMTPAEAEAESSEFEQDFSMLVETSDIFPRWKVLVEDLGVVEPFVHDARPVAICHVHGVSHVLTFDIKVFARLAGFGPEITVDDPSTA